MKLVLNKWNCKKSNDMDVNLMTNVVIGPVTGEETNC